MSYKVDRHSVYLTYKRRYPGFGTPIKNANSQVFTLYFDGVVSNKQEVAIMVPVSGGGGQVVRIAMPAYPKFNYRINRAKVSDINQQFTTKLIENLEVSVRDDLSEEYPSILLLTTSRAIIKYELLKETNRQSPLAGLLVNIVTAVSEVADLRSWNMLPSNIQFGYFETNESEIVAGSGNTLDKKIAVKPHSKNVVLISSLTDNIYHYQQ